MKENKDNVIVILMILICLFNTLGVLINTTTFNRLNNEIKAVARTVEVLHNIEEPGEYTCINIEEKGEDVVSRVMCKTDKTSYETWTYVDGRVDIVVNGE